MKVKHRVWREAEKVRAPHWTSSQVPTTLANTGLQRRDRQTGAVLDTMLNLRDRRGGSRIEEFTTRRAGGCPGHVFALLAKTTSIA